MRGTGIIYSYVIHHAPAIPGFDAPHIVVLVELDEGPRMIANLLGAEPRTSGSAPASSWTFSASTRTWSWPSSASSRLDAPGATAWPGAAARLSAAAAQNLAAVMARIRQPPLKTSAIQLLSPIS